MKRNLASPALRDLEILEGKWRVEIRWSPKLHKVVGGPASVEGLARFEWIEGGQYLVQRQGGADGPPEACWVIGRDEQSEEYSILYADARGASRVYQMSFKDSVWRIWRSAPGLNQRFEGRISADCRVIDARWEGSADGRAWELDFDLRYVRTRD
jgi:hypothetical protein